MFLNVLMVVKLAPPPASQFVKTEGIGDRVEGIVKI